MTSQVEEIKKKLDIIDVINRYLPLKKRGRHHVACCPFHGEKTPSFTVSPELQIFKCFGCGKSGDVFTFLQEFERIDFREALEELAKLAGVKLEHSEGLTQSDAKKRVFLEINHQLARFYTYILTSHPLGKKALEYVLNRGINLDTIKQFRLGYAPANSQLTINYLLKKGYQVSDLIATGTFGQSQYNQRLYDRFSDRLTFALCDFRDRILGFSGRVLPGAKPELAKYINSPETELYHKSHTLFGLNLSRQAIKEKKSVIVVEGEFDLISPYQSGVKNIVAIKGTAFTQDQLQLLSRYTDTLILGLDSDFAGTNAAKKSIEMADDMGFDIQVLTLGDQYKDPDEAIRADAQFFYSQLEKTLPIWDFIIQSAVKSYGIDTIKGKKQILQTVIPFINKISNQVIRSDYFQKLAQVIGSTTESIIQESKHYSTTPVVSSSTPITKTETPPQKIEKLEEYLLTLIFSSPKPLILLPKVLAHLSFTTSRFNQIISSLSTLKKFKPQKLSALLAPEIEPTFINLYLQATEIKLEAPSRRLEIEKVINQIKGLKYRQTLLEISQKIASAETLNQQSDLTSLENEYNQTLNLLQKLNQTKL
ncbi:MAG TPA: DNA primase, partial [Candidatus Woesebacteria bacterium]|nr:DNA primase [Candidatus Woesebacteria bacterium]